MYGYEAASIWTGGWSHRGITRKRMHTGCQSAKVAPAKVALPPPLLSCTDSEFVQWS